MRFLTALLFIPLVLSKPSTKISHFKINGKLTCYGEPIEAVVTMIDDNPGSLDHLLGYDVVELDGKYYVHGKPEDESLNAVLWIEHKCHKLKMIGMKLDGYSEVPIKYEEMIQSDFAVHKNIELSKLFTYPTMPVLHYWKSVATGRRLVKDNIDRLKTVFKSSIFSNIFKTA